MQREFFVCFPLFSKINVTLKNCQNYAIVAMPYRFWNQTPYGTTFAYPDPIWYGASATRQVFEQVST
jgi:hypothetical protein